MPNLTFYRQKRVDGGVRTGVESDGVTIASLFEEGDPDRDPALRWYVDLRCEGPALPDEDEESLRWLLDHATIILAGFLDFAEQLSPAGADIDDYPMKWNGFRDVPEGVTMTIAASAIRKVDAREFGQVLRDIGDHWLERLQALAANQVINR